MLKDYRGRRFEETPGVAMGRAAVGALLAFAVFCFVAPIVFWIWVGGWGP